MLKKEITETLKQMGVILGFLLLIPLVHQINEIRLPEGTSSLTNYMLNGGALVFAILVTGLAYMMFSREEIDESVEYLKTLPISKWELLRVKLLPRFLALSVPVIGICTFFAVKSPADIKEIVFLMLSPIILTIIVALIYGFFLGISDRKNPVLAGSIVLLTSYPIFFGSILAHDVYRNIINRGGAETSVYLYALIHFLCIILPALIPLFLLIPIYRSWDCSSGKIRSQMILKRLAVPSILIVILWAGLLPG